MDFSPYKKNKYSTFPTDSRNTRSKTTKYFYIILSIITGIIVMWFLQSLFSEDEGLSTYATFQKNTSIAESQREDIGIWSAIVDNSPITEGDTIHIKEENDGKVILPDSSFFSLGEESELTISKLRKTEENNLFGNITINKAPILFSGKSNFAKEKEFKIFVADNIYITGRKNTFYFDDNIVSFVDGEKVWVDKIDKDDKIITSREFGIGQSLNIVNFKLIPTGDILQSSELVAQYKGTEIKKSAKSETLEETTNLKSPILLKPKFEGNVIIVKNRKQKITGTTSLNTEKIIISFSNGTNSEELTFLPSLSDDEKTKEWSYTASEQYKTLLEGINSYKIYAINKDNKRSQATILLLSYNKDADITDSDNSEDKNDENNNKKSDINFSIISPNQGRDTQLEGDTIILNGTAGKDVAYITISNLTLDSSYTLQKYKKGQKTWKYWVDELKPDTYKYVVYAKDENKKILSTKKISITLTASPTATLQSTTQPETTIKPVVTTSSSSSNSTATPKPTIKSSTSEASR